MGVNKAIVIGNLGADPELRYTQGGTAVCNFRIATNEKWKDKEGNWQEKSEWHRIVVWGVQAENCEKYLEKGRQVYVEGRIQTRDWEDNDGNKRYTTEIVAQSVQFLSGGGESSGAPSKPRDEESSEQVFSDDIPFAFILPFIGLLAECLAWVA